MLYRLWKKVEFTKELSSFTLRLNYIVSAIHRVEAVINLCQQKNNVKGIRNRLHICTIYIKLFPKSSLKYFIFNAPNSTVSLYVNRKKGHIKKCIIKIVKYIEMGVFFICFNYCRLP